MSHDEDLPDWARITSDLVDTGEPDSPTPVPVSAEPATAPPAAPARPVATPVPAPTPPTGPSPTSTPVPIPVPVEPSPVPAGPVSVPAPPPTPSRPRPSEEFAPIDETPFDDTLTAAPPLEDSSDEPHAEIPRPPSPKATKKGRWQKKPAAAPAAARTGDGRRKVILLRIAVWGVLAVIALAGMRAIIAPPRTDVTGVLAQAEETYGLTTFPVDEGQAVAIAFAREYLTYAPGVALETARADRLRAFLTPNLGDATWLRSTSGASQNIVSGPYLAVAPEIGSLQRATFTIAAAVIDPKVAAAARAEGKTANPSWVYLAVPVYWANNGGLGVAGPPAFVPAPIAPDGGGGFNYAIDDEAATDARADLENFFRAWGASDAADLARYVPDAATLPTKTGLKGSVKFDSLSNIQIQAAETVGAERFAQMVVTWVFQGTEMRQGYRLAIFQDAEGRWYVNDITGGDFESS